MVVKKLSEVHSHGTYMCFYSANEPNIQQHRGETKYKEVVDYCLEMFSCPPAEETIAIRKCKFLTKFKLTSNILCRALTDKAELELSSRRPMSAVNG